MTWRGVLAFIAVSPFLAILVGGLIAAIQQWLTLPWPQMLLGAYGVVWVVATVFWLITRD
jgi:hypothetical protein